MFEHVVDFVFGLGGEGAGIGRILAGGASVFGETASFILRVSPEILDASIDFLIWKDITGDKKTNWQQWNSTEKHGEFSGQIKVMKSHVLLLEQLEKHAGGSEILEEYQKLGHNLPDKDLLKKVMRSLSMSFHPDHPGGNEEAFKAVHNAIEILKDDKHADIRASYNDMIQKAGSDPDLRERVKKFFNDFKGKQTDFYEAVERETQKKRLLLEGKISNPGKAEKLFESFKKSGPGTQGAIIFGAVTGTAMVAYGVASIYEKNKKRSASHVETLRNNSPQTAMAL